MRVKSEKSTDDNKVDLNSTEYTGVASKALVAFLAIAALSEPSLAGTTGTELQGVYTSVSNLMGGYGGRIIVAGGIIGSAILGYMRQSLGLAGTGIGLSVLVANGPSIADGMVSATI